MECSICYENFNTNITSVCSYLMNYLNTNNLVSNEIYYIDL